MRWIPAAILLLLSMAASAQTRPPAKSRGARPAPAAASQAQWPVETVEIEGLEHYTKDQARHALAIPIGRPAAPKDFDAARERLLATGAFESVACRYVPAPDGKGYAVTFQVVEAGPRFPVRFEDLNASEENLKNVLKRIDPFFASEIPATEPLLARYAQAIQSSLGPGAAKVVGKLEPDDQGHLAVVFRASAARPAISRVLFTGGSVVPPLELENAINTVAIGLPYKEPRFRQILDNQIRPLYETRGRVRVAFPEIRTEPDKQVKGVVVTIKVDEGPPYTLGAVAFNGTGLTQAELKKVGAGFKAGTPFNREVVQAGVVKLESRMRTLGFMHVKSTVDRRIDDQAKRVDLTVRVEPGPRYTFGKLTIQGLDLISEPAVRKMWGLKEGQPFNSEYPDYFIARVKEEGVFENLGGDSKSVLKTDDENHTVDVTLFFKGEAPKPKQKEQFPDTATPADLPI
jgi:outer membrane protein insertion porin family